MNNTFYNLQIGDCRVGISMPNGGTNDVFINPQINRCGVAIEYRDAPSLASSIGLPPGTPNEVLIKVLKILNAHEKADLGQKETLIKRSAIWQFIDGVANATSITANLITISTSPQIATILASLKNLNT